MGGPQTKPKSVSYLSNVVRCGVRSVVAQALTRSRLGAPRANQSPFPLLAFQGHIYTCAKCSTATYDQLMRSAGSDAGHLSERPWPSGRLKSSHCFQAYFPHTCNDGGICGSLDDTAYHDFSCSRELILKSMQNRCKIAAEAVRSGLLTRYIALFTIFYFTPWRNSLDRSCGVHSTYPHMLKFGRATWFTTNMNCMRSMEI